MRSRRTRTFDMLPDRVSLSLSVRIQLTAPTIEISLFQLLQSYHVRVPLRNLVFQFTVPRAHFTDIESDPRLMGLCKDTIQVSDVTENIIIAPK